MLGTWNKRASGPVNAFLVQGLISLALVGLGFITRKGFETIVEYTAPVFWFFFLMTGISLMVLRKKEPEKQRPFRVQIGRASCRDRVCRYVEIMVSADTLKKKQ